MKYAISSLKKIITFKIETIKDENEKENKIPM